MELWRVFVEVGRWMVVIDWHDNRRKQVERYVFGRWSFGGTPLMEFSLATTWEYKLGIATLSSLYLVLIVTLLLVV